MIAYFNILAFVIFLLNFNFFLNNNQVKYFTQYWLNCKNRLTEKKLNCIVTRPM